MLLGGMYERAKTILKRAGDDFFAAGSPSHGAALAFYAVTSMAPVLLIAVAIAGFVFGAEAARGAILAELRDLLGPAGAAVVQNAIESAADQTAGAFATLFGIGALTVTASGAFLELQRGLNDIWGVEPRGRTLSRFIRARAASFGLVVALGFLLLISLVADAAISALNDTINRRLPFGAALLWALNFAVSFVLIALPFAAIYKVLPAKRLAWRDVLFAAAITTLLLQTGKVAIGAYLGSGNVGSSFGAAAGVIGLLFWVYYAAQIVFFGAALTKAHMSMRGSRV